jgi:hypothetical protein
VVGDIAQNICSGGVCVLRGEHAENPACGELWSRSLWRVILLKIFVWAVCVCCEVSTLEILHVESCGVDHCDE